MNQTKRIRKNAKKMIEKIVAGAYDIRSFDLYYNFVPQELNSLESPLNRMETFSGYMQYCFTTKEYTIHIHSNNFYKFKSSFIPSQPKQK